MGPCMNMIGNLGYLLVAAFGGYFAAGGLLGIDAIQAVLQYSKQFTRPINEIANQYTQILTAMAGAERVFEIMDADSETVEVADVTVIVPSGTDVSGVEDVVTKALGTHVPVTVNEEG